MSQKNKIILILAQLEVNKILNNRPVFDLNPSEKILLTAYLTTMKNIYKGE